MMSVDARMNMADELLLYTDKITMNYSLECRVPMLDLELVEFIESLPAKHRVRIGKTKIIHKAFSGQALPAAIINREKKGFESPFRTWFGNQNILQDILLSSTSKLSSYIDLDEVRKVLADQEQGYNRGRHIFLLLSLHFWMEEFLAD